MDISNSITMSSAETAPTDPGDTYAIDAPRDTDADGKSDATSEHGFSNSESHSTICSDTDRRDCCHDLWNSADTWPELIKLNRAFLSGELHTSAYYSGQIHDETLPLVEDLLSLHDVGFLTYSSQPALIDGPKIRMCKCKRDCPDDWYHAHQRAFLSFLVPTSDELNAPWQIKAFQDALFRSGKFYASILTWEGLCNRGCCVIERKVRNNFPKKWRTHRRKIADTEEELENADFEDYQFIDPHCNGILRAFNKDAISHARPMIVHVLAKDWVSNVLAASVGEIAEEEGFYRNFEEGTDEDDDELSADSVEDDEVEGEEVEEGEEKVPAEFEDSEAVPCFAGMDSSKLVAMEVD